MTTPAPGPRLRTDLVEVYVLARPPGMPDDPRHVHFLQLRRTNPPAVGSWQPVMGHIEPGETAVAAGLRELAEETGLSPRRLPDGPAVWQLELVNTFYMATIDSILMCPGLAVEVDWPAVTEPGVIQLDDAHDQWRWTPAPRVEEAFIWPGQRRALRHLLTDILPPDTTIAPLLRIPPEVPPEVTRKLPGPKVTPK